jgi:amino acid transporter
MLIRRKFMTLQRSIGRFALLFASVGSIVGSGWLFGPLYVAQFAGPAAVLSWVLGGLLMLFIAFTFAELGTAFPVAGGMVHFGHMSHGSFVSFVMGWMIWLSSMVVAPIETLAVLQYMANYFPSLFHHVGNDNVLSLKGIGAAAVVMALMVALNAFGAKLFSKSSSALVVIKIAIPVIIIGGLFWVHFDATNFYSHGIMPNGWQGVIAALPLGGVIFSFIGFTTAIQLAGEAKNPQRAVSFAVIGSVAFCIILYAVLQIAFIGAVPSSLLQNGWHALAFKGDAGPIAGILALSGAVFLVILTYAEAVISSFGTGMIYAAGTARVTYALSENGFFSKYWHGLNRFGVPFRALALNYVVGMLLFLPLRQWESMAGFLVSSFIVSFSVGPLSLVVLRKTKKDVARPFKLPAHLFMSFLAFYVCNLMLFWAGWETVRLLLITSIVGFAVYFWRVAKKQIEPSTLPWYKSLWLVLYFAGFGTLTYLGSFGDGKNIIHFGWDFLFVGLFSLLIFCLAIRHHVEK